MHGSAENAGQNVPSDLQYTMPLGAAIDKPHSPSITPSAPAYPPELPPDTSRDPLYEVTPNPLGTSRGHAAASVDLNPSSTTDYDWDALSVGGSDLAEFADEEGEDDEDGSDHPNASGRISDVNLALVKDGFLEVMKLAKTVSQKTGLSTSQIFKQWFSINRRKHVRSNLWNLYAKYFKDNEKQELARLSTCKI